MEKPFSDYDSLSKLQIKNKVTSIKPKYESLNQAALLTDYIGGEMKKSLAESVANARYFTYFSDGSTDSLVTVKEVVYILFLDSAVPVVKYVSIEFVENANAKGVKKSIEDAFQGLGLISLENRLVGINPNRTSVNMGRKRCVATLSKESLPWLEFEHCFIHRLELALKDAFQDIKSFQMIYEMLMKIHYPYQNSPKRLRELKAFSNALEKAVPKPSKAY